MFVLKLSGIQKNCLSIQKRVYHKKKFTSKPLEKC